MENYLDFLPLELINIINTYLDIISKFNLKFTCNRLYKINGNINLNVDTVVTLLNDNIISYPLGLTKHYLKCIMVYTLNNNNYLRFDKDYERYINIKPFINDFYKTCIKSAKGYSDIDTGQTISECFDINFLIRYNIKKKLFILTNEYYDPDNNYNIIHPSEYIFDLTSRTYLDYYTTDILLLKPNYDIDFNYDNIKSYWQSRHVGVMYDFLIPKLVNNILTLFDIHYFWGDGDGRLPDECSILLKHKLTIEKVRQLDALLIYPIHRNIKFNGFV